MQNVKTGHSQPVVVLDPGHYGSTYNPGAVKGYYESEQMWKLCRLQKAAMEAYGIKVIVTRSVQAKDLALVERGKLAAGADIFESLHSNGCDTERVDRPECIYLVDDDCGAIDAQSKEFATLMAQTVRDCMDTDDPAKVFSRKSSYDRDGDGLKNDDYYGVLYGAHQVGTAACITEHSFHTNKAKAAWLLDDANLKKLAEAKAKAYAQWFGVEKATSTTASTTNTTKEEITMVTMNWLKKGAEGAQVKTLQALLVGYGYDIGRAGVDGIFGTSTDSAVRKFQSRNGLTTDGIVGDNTWNKLLGQ